MEGYLFDGDRREKPPQKENSREDLPPDPAGGRQHRLHEPGEALEQGLARGLPLLPAHATRRSSPSTRRASSVCRAASRPRSPSCIVGGRPGRGRGRRSAQYRELFGDRFYLELQDHGIAAQAPLNDELVQASARRWASPGSPPTTRTTRTRTTPPGHDVLLCINTGSELSDPNRFKFDSDEFYLKTPEEMAKKFARWPGACETTLEVAERCNVEHLDRQARCCRATRFPRARRSTGTCASS